LNRTRRSVNAATAPTTATVTTTVISMPPRIRTVARRPAAAIARTSSSGRPRRGEARAMRETALAARHRSYYDFVNAAGGFDTVARLVQDHAAQAGVSLTHEEALMMLEGWREWGVPQNMSLGEYLDQAWSDAE